jgi:hypothetical protein
VAWLTVREAAERLGISEAAVRKRMQRNTLKHRKWPDGRVYVKLGPRNVVPTDTDQPTRAAGAPTQEERRVWDLGQISALAGVLGAITSMTYILGVYVLWMPLAVNYTHDVATSLYSVSIVPRTMVIGHGLSRIWIPTLFVALVYIVGFLDMKPRLRRAYAVFLLVSSIAYSVWVIVGLLSGKPAPAIVGSYAYTEYTLANYVVLAAVCAVSLPALAFASAKLVKYGELAFGAPSGGDQPREPVDKDDGALPNPSRAKEERDPLPGRTLVLPGRFLIRLHRAAEDYQLFPHIVSRINFLKGIATVFALGFLLSILAATLSVNPPLPTGTMKISPAGESTNESQRIEGRLLAHTEGYWYVFDVAGKNRGELIALRDDQVENVTLASEDESLEGR